MFSNSKKYERHLLQQRKPVFVPAVLLFPQSSLYKAVQAWIDVFSPIYSEWRSALSYHNLTSQYLYQLRSPFLAGYWPRAVIREPRSWAWFTKFLDRFRVLVLQLSPRPICRSCIQDFHAVANCLTVYQSLFGWAPYARITLKMRTLLIGSVTNHAIYASCGRGVLWLWYNGDAWTRLAVWCLSHRLVITYATICVQKSGHLENLRVWKRELALNRRNPEGAIGSQRPAISFSLSQIQWWSKFIAKQASNQFSRRSSVVLCLTWSINVDLHYRSSPLKNKPS